MALKSLHVLELHHEFHYEFDHGSCVLNLANPQLRWLGRGALAAMNSSSDSTDSREADEEVPEEWLQVNAVVKCVKKCLNGLGLLMVWLMFFLIILLKILVVILDVIILMAIIDSLITFLGVQVDCRLAPNMTWPEKNCNQVFLKPESYADARLDYAVHMNLTLSKAPGSCQAIHSTDVASNASEAGDCTRWCEHHLGNGAGWPMATWMATHRAFPIPNETASIDLYITCLKSQVATLGAKVPSSWGLGIVYRFVGLIPAIVVARSMASQGLHGLQGLGEEVPEVQPPDQDGCRGESDHGPFPNGDLGFPLNIAYRCWRPASDLSASRVKLLTAAISILTEPISLVVSMVTFLKMGQPFYIAWMMFGLLLSSVAGVCMTKKWLDILQSQGARAWVQSFERGWGTREFFLRKASEVPENFISTAIQLHAATTLSPTEATSTVLMLFVFAGISVLLTFPEGTVAWILVTKTNWGRWFLEEEPEVDDFYQVQSCKKQIPWFVKHLLTVVVLSLVASKSSSAKGTEQQISFGILLAELLLVPLAALLHWVQRPQRDGEVRSFRLWVTRILPIFVTWYLCLVHPFALGLPYAVGTVTGLSQLELPRLEWPVGWHTIAADMQAVTCCMGILPAKLMKIKVLVPKVYTVYTSSHDFTCL